MRIPKPHTNSFKNPLFLSRALVWNSIPLSIKIANILDAFIHVCVKWLKNGKRLNFDKF